jgi:pimeloyl-ACP methyl ester carboxylesterase
MQDIYIDDIGSGFPLVLVHGYLGSSEMWSLQKEFLSKNFRVISPALPGFGESYKAQSLNSINAIAKFVFKCLDEKKITEFHLMGHSMGGMIVQEMVKISGDRIKKLICFATGSIGDIPGRFESMDTTRERLKKDGLKETVNRVPKKWFVEGNKAKYYYLCEHAVKNISIQSADNALIAMKNWRGYKNLKNIKQDTLIIWGDRDVSYNFDQVDTLKKNILNSKLEIFKDCCHNVHLEEPQKFNEIVKNFLGQY